jgi:hypothetical protein
MRFINYLIVYGDIYRSSKTMLFETISVIATSALILLAEAVLMAWWKKRVSH